jgi:uncharacterized protein
LHTCGGNYILKTFFNGITDCTEYKACEKLQLININDINIVTNNDTGGWAVITDKEMAQLFSPSGFLGDSFGEKAYLAGLARRNGSTIFDYKYAQTYQSQIYVFEFKISNKCNLECVYCCNDTDTGASDTLDYSIGKLWIDRVFEYVVDKKLFNVFLEFTGGEPLVNIDFMSEISKYAYEKFVDLRIIPKIVFSTNLTVLGPKQIDYIKKFKPGIQISMDGPKDIQDFQRPFSSNKSSYDVIMKNISILNKEGIDAKSVTSVITNYSVDRLEGIVDFFVDLGFQNISLQPMNALGRGLERLEMLPDAHLFVDKLFNILIKSMVPNFYKSDNIFSIKQISLVFAYLLEPWRMFMCKRCPCGSALNIISTSSDGAVYGCNQAPYNEHTILGNITRDKFIDCQNSENAISFINRSIKAKPKCESCLVSSFCQGGCPKSSLSLNESMLMPGDDCEINKLLFLKGIEVLTENQVPIDMAKILANSFLRKKSVKSNI